MALSQELKDQLHSALGTPEAKEEIASAIDSSIKNDGSVQMEEGYSPSNDLDIATKKYVDDNSGGGGGSGDLKADGTVPLTANWNIGPYTLTSTMPNDIALIGITHDGTGVQGNADSGGYAVVGYSGSAGTGLIGETATGISAQFLQDDSANVVDCVQIIDNSATGMSSSKKMLNVKNATDLGQVSVFNINLLGEVSTITGGLNIKAAVANAWWGGNQPTIQSTLTSVAGGAFVISTVDVASADGSAAMLLNGGTSLGPGGGIFVVGGDSTGVATGGSVQLYAGNSASGDGGNIALQSGNGLANNIIQIVGGSMNNAGVQPQISLVTGANAGAGYSGGILLQTASQANRGVVTIDAASLDMSSKKINNVANPSSAQDAATKAYVDANAATPTVIGMRYHNATATVTGTPSKLTFSSSDYDTNSAYSSGIFTVPAASGGKYSINGQVIVVGTFIVGNFVEIGIYVNNSLYSRTSELVANAAVNYLNFNITDMVNASAGDTFEVRVSSDGTLPTINNSNTLNFLSINRIGI